jgi:hypothetical protein
MGVDGTDGFPFQRWQDLKGYERFLGLVDMVDDFHW